MTDTAELETRIAFLDQASQDLSDVLARQQQQLELLERGLAQLAARVQALESRSDESGPGEELPPHY
ncbi:MAG: SlyX family protein [Gammaproteobacteria bacterium]